MTSRISIARVQSARIAILTASTDIDVSASSNSVTHVTGTGVVVVAADSNIRASSLSVTAVGGTVIRVITRDSLIDTVSSSSITEIVGTSVRVGTVLGGEVADTGAISVTSVNSASVVIVTRARAAGTVSLTHAAAISDRTEELDGRVDLEVRLGSMSLGKEDVKVVVLTDCQAQGSEIDGSILGSVDSS